MSKSLALVVACCLAASSVAFGVTPSYTVQRAVGTMVIDGSMNDFSWQNAAATANYVKWDGSGTQCPQTTTVKAVWDSSYLYLGFQSNDTDIFANLTGRDVETYKQDNAEVFITNPNAPAEYVEFEACPNNAYWDGYYTSSNFTGPGASWNSSGFRFATSMVGTLNNKTDTDTKFTIEMAIPWADVYRGAGVPVNGTTLRANFNRINWDTAGVNDTYWGWSATPGAYLSFHRPASFGQLVFSTTNVPEPTTMALLGLGAATLLRRRK